MMLSCDWRAVGQGLPAQLVRSALSISGLYDLAPIARTPFLKDDLRLTPASVKRLSPALFPAPRGRLCVVAGAEESAEFLRQNALIAERWGRRAVPVCEAVPGVNHFTILHALADPASRLHGLALDLLGLPPAA
jgi:arylformamidase